MKKEYTDELIFRALGDRHRLAILAHLLEREMNAGEILAVVDVVQSTLSHHMKILTSSGLVNARRAGKCTYYTINTEAVIFVTRQLENYLNPAPPGGETGRQEPEIRPEPKRERKTKQKPEKTDKPEKPEETEEPEPMMEHEDIATPIVYDESVKEKEPDREKEKSSEHTGKDKQRNRKEKNKNKGKGKDKEKNKSKAGGKKKK